MIPDVLRLSIAPMPRGRRFQLLVHVNDVELTSAADYLGMEPFSVLLPVNLLAATAEPHTVSIGRCRGCELRGCCDSKVTITREGNLVHWDWGKWPLMPRRVTFLATQYEAEIARAALDDSWETPPLTAGRLVLTNTNLAHLGRFGLSFDFLLEDVRDRESFHVCLVGQGYQVYLGFRWDGRSPTDLAAVICATLALPPQQWDAIWWPNLWELRDTPPAFAGPSWRRDPQFES